MDLEEDDPVGDGEGWAWSPGRGEGLGLTPGSALSGLLSSLGDFPPPSWSDGGGPGTGWEVGGPWVSGEGAAG